MVLVDTFDSDDEAVFLTEKLKKNKIEYTEKQSPEGKQVYINEADMTKLNELITGLD